MVSRVIVGAHYGLRGWMVQRVSAVVMALYVLVFVAILLFARPTNFGEWRALFAGQAMKLAVNLVVHDLNAALGEALRLHKRLLSAA